MLNNKNRRQRFACACLAFYLSASLAHATIFGRIQGVVHDPQHRPVLGALVRLNASASGWSQEAISDATGEFNFNTVPVGDYNVTISKDQFQTVQQVVVVDSGSSPVLHLQLALATLSQTAIVTAESESVNPASVTPQTLLSREDIAQTPGADRTNSMAIITDFVPGAYMAHDMLHMRGGHQVDWLVDGVPIPNTNIASNLGPQIDPKDIDYLEVQRGSYEAEYGDRTYGIFNIVPRSGFERDNQAELTTSFGNWFQTNDQLSVGGHSKRFAYYVSANANRSNYGLQTPIGKAVHDADNGFGGFASLIFNASPANQLRLVASLRRDYYQIPIDPDPNSPGNRTYVSFGLHDSESEPDGYLAFSWVHSFSSKLVLTVSPFYHYNQAAYHGSPNDSPVITNVNESAHYGGGQTSILYTGLKRNDLEAGFYGFAQHQTSLFNNVFTGCEPDCQNFGPSAAAVTGTVAEVFFSDRFKVTSWLTLIAGFRQTHFSSGSAGPLQPQVIENATDPRFGIAVRIPKINLVFRGFYGEFFQTPPLLTATGPLLNLADSQNLAFAPLHGERNKEYQFGVAIPFHGWVLDTDVFRTTASNWLDHSNIGESNLFFPVTWNKARIRGWETTIRSPRIWHRGQAHLAYSNQTANDAGPFSGGLVCADSTSDCEPPSTFKPVDHDQRNTLNFGFSASLPKQSFASTNVYYGSGFANGLPNDHYPGTHLPQHTTIDVSAGKSFGNEGNYRLSFTAINVSNRRLLLDNSLTFGGFHFNDPRQLYVEFRWRFHY